MATRATKLKTSMKRRIRATMTALPNFKAPDRAAQSVLIDRIGLASKIIECLKEHKVAKVIIALSTMELIRPVEYPYPNGEPQLIEELDLA